MQQKINDKKSKSLSSYQNGPIELTKGQNLLIAFGMILIAHQLSICGMFSTA